MMVFDYYQNSFEHFYKGCKFFIIMKREHTSMALYSTDTEISIIMSLTIEQYQEIMKNRFNGIISGKNTFFGTEDDVNNACEFLNMTYKFMDR